MKLLTSATLCAVAVGAQSIIDSVSFGQGDRLSRSTDSLPGWTIKGEGHNPQILSNKLILTPPYPGHTRGSLWAENALSESEWTTEFQFRASGPERGSGNLQLWYVKDGESGIGASSIYTVGKFDGFALTIDTHGGRGGSIRGFLNDGTTAYNHHANVDSLAFGHCDYPYRNLGRPSVVLIKQSSSAFEVTVDDKLCFQTPKVSLPSGYKFGITAATPDTPDSFELFKFLVTQGARTSTPPPGQQQQQQQQPIQPRSSNGQAASERPAADYTISQSQFVDLRNGIQQLSSAVNDIYREISQLAQNGENRHQELLRNQPTGDAPALGDQRYNGLNSRLQRIENILQSLQRDSDYRNQFAQLHKAIESSHHSLTEALQTSIFNMINAATPRMGLFIFLIIAVQFVLAAGYIYYKRRRNSMPKKFL